MNKEALWFRHDSNAKDDPKCVLLIEQLGMEGYGIFWALIEILREQPDLRYPMNLLPAVARKYNTTPEKVKTVVGAYDLFQVENEDRFFSTSLMERMNALSEYKALLSEAGRKGAKARLKGGSRRAKRIEGNRTEKSKEELRREEIIVGALPHGLTFESSWKEWVKHRVEKKHKLTPSTAEKQIQFLGERPEPEACAIIQQSILNGWQGLFPLKKDSKPTSERADPMTL